MTLQSQRRSRARQHNIDRALQVVVLGLCGLALGAAVITLPGCTSSSRTRVEPAVTNATQQIRTERAGRTKTTTTTLEIIPQGSKSTGETPVPPKNWEPKSTGETPVPPKNWEPKSTGETPMPPKNRSLSHVESPYGGGGAHAVRASLTPAAWSTTVAHLPGENRANDASHNAPFALVGYRPKASENPDDSAIGRAIEQAARNGSTIRYEVTEHEDIPLTADTANATLSDSGPGLATSSDEAAIGFDGRKGGARLPWGGTSGKTSWGLDASLVSGGVNVLHIMGGIVMIAAVIPVISPPRRWLAAGIVALTGLLIVAAGTVSEQAPWVFVLAILAFLGLAGWLGYEAWRNKRRQVALETIVTGVENAQFGAVKDNIAKAAGDSIAVVKNETNAVKAKLKLRSPESH